MIVKLCAIRGETKFASFLDDGRPANINVAPASAGTKVIKSVR